MSDDVRLSARLWLPVTPGRAPSPAIIEYIPYRKRDMARLRDERNHTYFARCGYACIRVDMRGSGDSEGLMTDMYSPNELGDAVEIIEWIAAQPWCNGSVGMMGTSWGGTSSLQAAANRPPALKAIIAVCATNNRFEDDIHWMGGCLLTDTVEWGAALPAILASPPDPDTVGSDWRRIWMERLEGISFPLENWISHQIRDAYWRQGSVNEVPESIECPVLLIGGWVDRYSNTVMNFLSQHSDRCWGIIGPWGHHYPDQACPGPGIGFQQEAVRWWDHWLKGVNNGIESEPKLRVWMQEYIRPENKLEKRPGRWISEPTWPSKNILPELFSLASSNHLQRGKNSGDARTEVPVALDVGVAAGDTGYFGREGGLPTDQQVDDNSSLVFDSDPLTGSVEILGAVRLMVRLESDQTVASLVARLNDVSSEGHVARISYAIRNLALNDKLDGPSHLVANKPQSFVIEFSNTAYRLERGHRIRLSISSSYWPIVWPSSPLPKITLYLADTQLKIPLRTCTVDKTLVQFAQPLENTSTGRCIVKKAPSLERWLTNDSEPGIRSIGWKQPFKCVRYPGIDLDFGYETSAWYRIKLNDPNSASSKFDHQLYFQRGDWVVEVNGITELVSTETMFKLSGSLVVQENGELIFERCWSPEIPRYP